MSFNAASLQVMLEKGLSLKDVVEIAAAMDSRSKAAERQSKYRKRKAERDVTRDVTQVPLEDTSTLPVPPSVISDEITPPVPKSNGSQPPILLPEHVLEAWNAMADRQGLSKAKLTPERRRQLTARIRGHSIDDFTEAIAAIERSPFLRGENDRGWRADFSFFLQPKSFTKLIEGAYDH